MGKSTDRLIKPSKEFILNAYNLYGTLSHMLLYGLSIASIIFSLLTEINWLSVLFQLSVSLACCSIDSYLDEKADYVLTTRVCVLNDKVYGFTWSDHSGDHAIIIPLTQIRDKKRKLDGYILHGDFTHQCSNKSYELINKVYIDDTADGADELWELLNEEN